ncbi:hypothetical protein F5X99DRAFT_414432 [Biscogniauxia marginata]|nr:hypothetical protein F5X99DRAFT_414432 [Biscogniauxia marginata]
MEAVAAVGAVPGLASAFVQLGTFTFHFYQQLRSLQKAIKQSKEDITTSTRRLCQHEEFTKFNFETIPDGQLSPNLQTLFRQCLADSQDEFIQFRALLEHIGKHRFKSKSLQAIDTGTRLHLNEDSIQKYCHLLDAQMTRFLYFQTSVQSSQISASYSVVEGRLTQQGDKAEAFYASSESTMQRMETAILSQLQAISGDLRASHGHRPSLERGIISPVSQPRTNARSKVARSFCPQELLSYKGDTMFVKRYQALCGSVIVTAYGNYLNGHEHETQDFSYTVRFVPFAWFSRTLVEWRCFLATSQNIPFLALSCACGTICDDDDVMDALGFVTSNEKIPRGSNYSPYYTKTPDSRKVRRLLDENRFSRSSILPAPHDEYRQDVLSAFVKYHQLCKQGRRRHLIFQDDICDYRESDPVYQAHFYAEYFEVLKLLLERGFQPSLSSWESLLEKVFVDRYHVMADHPELRGLIDWTCSAPLLIQNAAGFTIPLNYSTLFPSEYGIRIYSSGYRYTTCTPAITSGLAPLIAFDGCIEIIRREVLDLMDLAADEMKLDRWILVIFSASRPNLSTILNLYLETYQSASLKSLFRFENVLEEIRLSSSQERRALIQCLGLHGRLDMLKPLSLSREEIQEVLFFAAQDQDTEKFNLPLQLGHCGGPVNIFFLFSLFCGVPHTKMVQDRLISDSTFRELFIDILISGRVVRPDTASSACENKGFSIEPIYDILQSAPMLKLLVRSGSEELPEYVDILVSGLIQRYEEAGFTTRNGIQDFLHKAMVSHLRYNRSAEDIIRPLCLFHILRQLTMSVSFQSEIDDTCYHKSPIWNFWGYSILLTPSTEGYTALMIALGCGMIPAVQILVDAGASILLPTPAGKSPLQLANENVQSSHPRQWFTLPNGKDDLVLSTDDQRGCCPRDFWVAESTDKAMLEILLEALRDRGEEANLASPTKPLPSKWSEPIHYSHRSTYIIPCTAILSLMGTLTTLIKSKTRSALVWLTRPRYSFDDPRAFCWACIHFLVVTALGLLSVLHFLKLEYGGHAHKVVNLLSRPVVLLSLVVWILAWLFR